MKLARLSLTVVVLAVFSFWAGCGGDSSPRGLVDMSVALLDQEAPPFDFFVGRYSCSEPLAQYCATPTTGGCIFELSGLVSGDGGCDQIGRIRTCGDDTIVEYLGDSGVGTYRLTAVYSTATQQLVAVLLGDGDGQTTCLGGPTVYVNPALISCPLDAGTVQLFCAPHPVPGCGPLARKCV